MKRFLSLVLALVMTMSLVTIAGAKDFTDAEAINYAEAIDVVSAIGIIDGYTDGSFNPQGGLTRGAAAKIICNLILGPTAAGDLKADTAPYPDVPTTNVFAGYIAYCQAEGIINGYADGTFKPAGSLTGFAFMKMLLGALGYDAEIEEYVGANWSVSVAKQALAIGLEDGLEEDFDGYEALTREEACLYAFNTLKATMVEYGKSSNITVGDIEVDTTSTLKKIPNTSTRYNASDLQDTTMEFCEKYFEDLTLTPDIDVFGRPAGKWMLEREEIGIYAEKADYTVVISDDYQSIETVDELVKYILKTERELEEYATDKLYTAGYNGVWFNGVQKTQAEVNAIDATFNGNGIVLELFMSENDKDYIQTVAAYAYTLAKIEDVDTETVTDDDKKDGVTAYIDLGDAGIFNDIDIEGYDPDTYVTDTYIAYITFDTDGDGKEEIVDSHLTRTVKGVIGTQRKPFVKIGSNKYIFTDTGINSGAAPWKTFDYESSYTLYMDKNGFVLGAESSGPVNIDDLVYVTDVYYEESGKYGYTIYAETVSLTGEIKDIEVGTRGVSSKKKIVHTVTDAAKEVSYTDVLPGLYTIVWDRGEECYNLIARATGTGSGTASADYKYYAKANFTDEVKTDALSVTLSSKVFIDSETKFISIKTKASGYTVAEEVTTAAGRLALDANSNAMVVALTPTDSLKADYILYVGSGAPDTVGYDDVLFIARENNVHRPLGCSHGVYFMSDPSASQTITVAGSDHATGFYSYKIDKDDVYVVTRSELTLGGGFTVDEDTTGGTPVVSLTDWNVDFLSAAKGGVEFADVDASGAKVIDLRPEAGMEKDVISSEITSVKELERAIELCRKSGAPGYITARLYFKEGKVAFISVSEVPDKTKDEIGYVFIRTEGTVTDYRGRQQLVYFVDSDTASAKTITAKDDGYFTKAGFYKYTIDRDGVYTLTLDEIDKNTLKTFTLAADTTAGTGEAVSLFSVAGNDLTTKYSGNTLGTADLANAVVLDTRSDAAIAADAYNTKITTVDELKAAIVSVPGQYVTARVFFHEGEVAFISVAGCPDAPVVNERDKAFVVRNTDLKHTFFWMETLTSAGNKVTDAVYPQGFYDYELRGSTYYLTLNQLDAADLATFTVDSNTTAGTEPVELFKEGDVYKAKSGSNVFAPELVFASDAKVRDDSGKSINTVAKLKTALDSGNVTAFLFFDEGEVIFVSVPKTT